MTLDELTKAIAGARERANLIGSDADASKVSGAEYMSAAYQRVWEDRKALLAVIDQLLPDARRYQWLREHCFKSAGDLVIEIPNAYDKYAGGNLNETLDTAIDRAIEGER